MLTPYDETLKIHWSSFEQLVEWYLGAGSQGLFASCLSSDLFQLTREERREIIRQTLVLTRGRIPVIAAGAFTENVSSTCAVLNSTEKLADEVNRIADLGVRAVVLLTNQFATPTDPDSMWLKYMEATLSKIRPNIRLGLYECPVPYKRLLTPKLVQWASETGRFYFIKDTCCDLEQIRARLQAIKSVPDCRLRLYNAHTGTLFDSLLAGAHGFSGVGSNAIPHLYAWLCRNAQRQPDVARELQVFLIESTSVVDMDYPQSVRLYLNQHGFNISHVTRLTAQNKLQLNSETLTEFHRSVVQWERRLKLNSPFEFISPISL